MIDCSYHRPEDLDIEWREGWNELADFYDNISL